MEISEDLENKKLQAILLSRETVNWPHSASLSTNEDQVINNWLAMNCQKKYKIFRGYSKSVVFFESESDLVSYQLTWL